MKTLILCLLITIYNVQSQTISCGQTVTGTKGKGDGPTLTFTSTGNYDSVTLDGCKSTFDLVLVLKDATGTEIARASDNSCPSSTAEQITIPNTVHTGEVYTFLVPRSRAKGSYAFTLNCIAASRTAPKDVVKATPAPTTPSPTTPAPTTPAPTTPAPSTSVPIGEGSIVCGQKITGYREKMEEVEIVFTATDNYDVVYLEGCESKHDIWLEIKDESGNTIASQDDENRHGALNHLCGDKNAGDITIPTTVSAGDRFIFIVKSFDRGLAGEYTVELVCNQVPKDCPRHREPWHLLSQSERNLYINGFKTLANQGKIHQFTQTHVDSAKHMNNGFLGWHRLFLYEIETAIRNLGGVYTCFGLPYWDWTYDMGMYDNIADYNILNSGLGGAASGGCVGGDWSATEYTPLNPEINKCLTRNCCTKDCTMTGASGLMAKLTSNGAFNKYTDELEGDPHAHAHMRIGGSGGSLADPDYSPDDPIFYLLHCMIDYQWTLWEDCRDYENTDKAQVMDKMYVGDDKIGLDDVIPMSPLSRFVWAVTYQNDQTYRDMYDNAEWGVTYDKGDYFTRGQVESDAACGGSINANYFKDITRRRRLADEPLCDYEEYSQETFKRLNNKVGGNKNKSLEQNELVYKTWAQMDCEYKGLESRCTRPKYFDDCSDMEATRLVYGRYDIDITLDELIEKVADYPCMVATRNDFYNWAYRRGELLALCQGKFDPFCDKDFENDKGGDKCLEKLKKKSEKTGAFQIFEDGPFDDGIPNNKLTEVEHILLSAVANGIIMTLVIATFLCCYWIVNYHKSNNSKQKVEYDIVDIDY